MRIDTSGNQFDNHGSAHRITHGFHDHHGAQMKAGEIRSAATSTSLSEQTGSEAIGEGLGFWRTITDGAKSLWGHIWGSSTGGVNEVGTGNEDAVGVEQLMAQVGESDVAEGQMTPGADIQGASEADIHGGSLADTHGPTVAAAASVAQTSLTKENPYFTAVSDKEETKDSFMQKVRIRFRELTDQFKKRFSGRFGGRMAGEYSGRGTLNSEQQKPKEDLRKHSRYREDGLEMDCVLTDDSYLMDSYDRSGGYSRLTTDTGAKNRTAQE